MSKVLEATCAAGIVTSGGFPVVSATVLSQGIGPSTGFLILCEDAAYYVAKTSPDLDATLQQIITALTDVATALTAIGAGMTGPTTAPPPTLGVNVASITAAAAALTTLKAILR